MREALLPEVQKLVTETPKVKVSVIKAKCETLTGAEFSWSFIYKIMRAIKKPVKLVSVHQITDKNKASRSDFSKDMLYNLERKRDFGAVGSAQGGRRFSRKGSNLGGDDIDICWSDESLIRCRPKENHQNTRIWIDKDAKKEDAMKDPVVKAAATSRYEQYNPGLMVSGFVGTKMGMHSHLHICDAACKVDTQVWLDICERYLT